MMVQVPSGLLAGRTAVIAGGTGSVGRVVVRGFLEAGARVVVPSRSPEKLAAMEKSLGKRASDRLVTLVGDLSDERDSVRLREQILERVGPLDAAVASLGQFVPAPRLLDASRSDLQRALDGYLVAHFMVVKALFPILEEKSGSYTFINGPLAFDPLFPGTGLVSVATAGQAMLAQTAMKEEAEGAVRINEVVIYTRFARGEDEPQRGAVSQEAVAAYLAYLASRHGAAVRGQTVHLDNVEPLEELQAGT